ncbi:MAG: radical SAM family heme chaperone HemW [Bacteroidota bacterium]
MSGLYLHIPFCKQACHYCNFHFSTSLRGRAAVVEAIAKEIQLRSGYLPDRTLHSVYFGGGTPSLLQADDIALLFKTIQQEFDLAPDAEITLEANPDDINEENLVIWANSSLNRLSIGVQSFAEEDLRLMNRAHNAEEARHCIQLAQQAGFNNLTIDLIYGSPSTTDAIWEENINTALSLNIPHLSCYALTVEPKTALAHQIATGKAPPLSEDQAATQFEYLMQRLQQASLIHYEINSFARTGYFARHNSSYWQQQPYLGVGPSAHSFDGVSRQWNIANNALYVKAIDQYNGAGTPSLLYEREVLSPEDRYNEYVMTGLRTIWGVSLDRLEEPFRSHFQQKSKQFIDKQLMHFKNKKYVLNPSGRLLADGIASELFY